MSRIVLIFGILILILHSCSLEKKRTYEGIHLSFDDPVYIDILNLGDRLQSDSLHTFLANENPSYRFAAANALASIRDPRSMIHLKNLLDDPFEENKTIAAYAIGQCGNERGETYLIQAFQDSVQVNSNSNRAILEALGKVGSEETLNLISRVSTYLPTDTLLLLGQSQALFHFALRDMVTREGTATMVKYVTEPEYPDEVQLWAANYLARAKSLDIGAHKFQLASALNTHDDPNVRMCIATCLRNTSDAGILNIMLDYFESEQDYRVKCNMIRAFNNYEYIQVVEKILAQLENPNFNISATAADYLIRSGKPGDALIYKDYLTDKVHWITRAKVYQAINKHLPRIYSKSRFALINRMKTDLLNSENQYERGALYEALSEDPTQYVYIAQNGMQDSSAYVRTTSVRCLANIFKNEQFSRIYFTGERRAKEEILSFLQEAIGSNDVGMISEAAGLFSSKDVGLKNYIDETDFLKEAQSKLILPRDIEANNIVQQAIDYLDNNPKQNTLTPEFNHPIPFDIVRTISDSTMVVIKTTKGNILVQLFPESAPGSAANFIHLSKDGFYNNKYFHRVVPNFVIQTGCPRGDGYGSLNYTIRSELTDIKYDEPGYLGMASAGNHTECSQWFITHSPTLHLDGRYTIFGKVKQGMEVVHAIEQGDKINSIQIK
jgi:cyclophilin family peptidyl-prolyl cis-trans isomerase/HEAT repeat protein